MVVLLLIYFTFRTQWHCFDAVLAATLADCPESGTILYQNHLLYVPLVITVLKPLRALGYTGSSLAPGAFVSATLAALAAGTLFLFFRRVHVARGPALVATLGAAFSAGWWYLAGEAEVLSGISFFTVGTLLILTMPLRGWRGGVAAAAWLALGACHHLVVLLLFPAAAFILAVRADKGRWRLLGAFAATAGVLSLLPYYIVYRFHYTPAGWGSFYKWITFLEWWGPWGEVSGRRIATGILRIPSAFVVWADNIYLSFQNMDEVAVLRFLFPGTMVLGTILAVTVASWRRLWLTARVWLGAAGIWFVCFQLFFTWWEPTNPEWWVATTLPFWLVFGLAAPAGKRLIFTAAIIGAMVAVNFSQVILPSSRPRPDPALTTARSIARVTRPGDAVLISDLDTLVWLNNITRATRVTRCISESANLYILDDFTKRFGYPGRDRPDVFLSDYELDNPVLNADGRGAERRAALFRILRGGHPVATVAINNQNYLFYRCGRPLTAPALIIKEAENPSSGKTYVAIHRPGESKRFTFNAPQDGKYVFVVHGRFKGDTATLAAYVLLLEVNDEPTGWWSAKDDCWKFYDASVKFRAGANAVTLKLHKRPGPSGDKNAVFHINRVAIYRDMTDTAER